MNETEEEDEVHEEVRVLKDHFQQLLKTKTEIEKLRKKLEKLKKVVKEKYNDCDRKTSYGKGRF